MMSAIAAAIMAGCSKDEEAGYILGPIEGMDDLTGYINVIYIDLNGPSPDIRLYAEEPVYAAAKSATGGFIAAIERQEGKQFLRFYQPEPAEEPDSAAGDEEAETLSFPFACRYDLTYASDEKYVKSLYVVFRGPAQQNSSEGMVSDPAAAIGCGMDITGDIGGKNIKDRLLDYAAIFGNPTYRQGELYSRDTDRNQTQKSNETSGKGLRQVAENMMSLMGVNGFRSQTTASGAKYAFESELRDLLAMEKDKDEEDYEYYANYFTKTLVTVSLTAAVKSSSTSLIAFADSTVCSILNNPNDEGYKNYPNTRSGIFALLDRFGTHVMTQGTFGGRHMYIYGRVDSEYPYKVPVSASYVLGSLFSGTQPQTYTTVLKPEIMAAELKDGKPDPAVELKTEAVCAAAAIGGNETAKDIQPWINSLAVADATYTLISYKGDDTNLGGLTGIGQLIVDPARKAALEEYMNEYLESRLAADQPE